MVIPSSSNSTHVEGAEEYPRELPCYLDRQGNLRQVVEALGVAVISSISE